MRSRRQFIGTSLAALAGGAAASQEEESRLAGITVLPEFIQSEGADAVLKNLIERAGANAVTTSPYVMEPADEKTGSREPPIDAGAGSVRKLDRDLFGRRELFVRTAPSFTPDKSLYRGLRYQPPEPGELTRKEGAKVGGFIRAAKKAGLKVFLQVQAASPPGYRVQFSGLQEDDMPRMVDGRVPPRRVDKNASLASPHIAQYARAMAKDLLKSYPELDGLRVDWPEYPPYFLDALLLDFCDHTRAAAERFGMDFESMKRDAEKFRARLLGGLTNQHLEALLQTPGMDGVLEHLAAEMPGVIAMGELKARLVAGLLEHFREALDEAGGKSVALVPNAFPPPWNAISGFDFSRCLSRSAGVSVKLYSMHWAMMVRFYGEALLKANPGLDERLLARALVHWLDIADDGGLERLSDYRYPEPHEAHPCGLKAIERKIVRAQKDAGAKPVLALAHGYGPADDFRRRLQAASRASRHGFWVNRYGYLSDEKLAVIREIAQGV